MTAVLADHLWQTTACAIAVWLAALALRRHRAELRFWLWGAASLKFLVPFAALVIVGQRVPWPRPSTASRPVVAAVTTASQPFSHLLVVSTVTSAAGAPRAPFAVPWLAITAALWALGTLIVVARWARRLRALDAVVARAAMRGAGREWDALQRMRALVPTLPALAVSDAALEPGLIGIRRPVLLWPARLTARLSDEQIDAIMAHELCHLRRRDNLFATLHMAIEAVFWFHPLAWWIGRRMVDERERACDEFVLRMGSGAVAYADSILKSCAVCAELPLANASGVTGAGLKQRIREIVDGGDGRALGVWGRVALVAGAVALVAAPLVIGAQAPAAPVPTFEVASIKPNDSGQMGQRMGIAPGGRIEATNVTLHQLVLMAYGLRDFQVSGEPDWMTHDRFDVTALVGHEIHPDSGGPGQPPLELRQMMQSLLAERFKLSAHQDKKDSPIYVLTQAKPGRLGPKMQVSTVDCAAIIAKMAASGGPPPQGKPGEIGPCSTRMGNGEMTGRTMNMTLLARVLSNQVGRIVTDETGLAGSFDIDLSWAPDQDPDAVGASLFTAVQEQLGLKLTSARGAVDVLVIDHAEKPTPD
jgi:uncharacterized protein (TIGR03435 family)